jgi:regulator of replication initiation timing
MSKIKKEHLDTIIDQQTRLNKALTEVGVVEARKHAMLHEMSVVNQEVEDFKKVLEEEYGQVNINLEDGSYSKIEELEKADV